MGTEKRAENLIDVYRNFELTNLNKDSEFYVDVNEARDGKDGISVKDKILFDYKECSTYNCKGDDEYKYERQLFIGHKACGKTTELHQIENKLQNDYYTIYISDIERSEDRISSQTDFLYFIIEKILENCKNNTEFNWDIEADLDKLQTYLTEKIFGVVSKEIDTGTLLQMEGNVELSMKPFIPVIRLLAKLGGKSSFAQTTNEKLTLTIKNNFSEFLDISNQIILKIQNELRRKGKMLLLILDGLDKVKESVSEEIFLETQSFLTQLNCSMIVTFPIYLLYSSRKDQATARFSDINILSMIKVHEKDGSDCESGIEALKKIAEKRMDKNLFGKEELLDESIRLSGGNLRDYFKFIRASARNSAISGNEKIEENALEKVYKDVKSSYYRQLTEIYMPLLEELYGDKDKTSLIRKTPQDDMLLKMFESGLLIEYNGDRWCDLHPLVKQIVADRIEREKEKEKEND